MGKSVQSYTGGLSLESIAKGMNLALENSARLAADAEILFAAGRYPTAASLAALSIEESGKVGILRMMSVIRDPKALKEKWREYRTHSKKNVAWIMGDLVSNGARKLDDFHRVFDPLSDHADLLDTLKQLGFYTDCLGARGNWSSPEDIVTEALALKLVEMAKIMARKETHTLRELELWQEHIGPVQDRPLDWMKQALIKWYAAMQEEGLAPAGPNHVEQFIKEGIAIRASPKKLTAPAADEQKAPE
jgi:AbiV family abortive infection protein